MKKEEKLTAFKEKGYSYDSILGKIFNEKGIEVLHKTNSGYIECYFTENKIRYRILAHQLMYYLHFNKIPEIIDHINGVRNKKRKNR